MCVCVCVSIKAPKNDIYSHLNIPQGPRRHIAFLQQPLTIGSATYGRPVFSVCHNGSSTPAMSTGSFSITSLACTVIHLPSLS